MSQATELSPSTAPLDPPALVSRLRATFASGRTRPLAWRKQQLGALHDMLTAHEDELVDALHADLGRPRVEALMADIGHTRAELRYMRRHVERWARPRRIRKLPLAVGPSSAYVVPEPVGVALVIAPWNYPIALLVEPVAAALAAGNCVVAKPSELAPACSAALARLLPRYLDGDACAVVEGGVAESTALLDQRWDHIFFTGSTSVGRIVAAAAARHLTPTTLELGGKSPVYVHASADLDVAAARIAWGKFINAGQSCVAPDYVLADRSIRDELVERLVDQTRSFFGADPKDSPHFARIVTDHHVRRLARLLHGDSESGGPGESAGDGNGAGDGGAAGTVVTGGDVDRSSRFVPPTITVDPDPDAPIMQEEVFGPILPVLAVDGPEQAIDVVTSRPKPLALYVFGRSRRHVRAVVDGTSSGGVGINHTMLQFVPPQLPFGGVGDSGLGSYHGRAGFDTFSHHKSVLRAATHPHLRLTYPPYTRRTERLVKRLLG